MARDIPILERRFVPKGKVIIHEGDQADKAYILQSGTAKVLKHKGAQEVELATLKVGDIFGESALLFDEPRMATVQAEEDCNLIIITRAVLEAKLADSDATIRAIVKMMKDRLKAGNEERMDSTATGIKDAHKLFNDAFKLVASFVRPDLRTEYQHRASPILREFLDLTQTYLDKR